MVLKPTRLATNNPHLARVLERKCPGGHQHIHLLNGRAAAAARYTPAFCRAVVQGLRRQRRADLLETRKVGELLSLVQDDPEEMVDVLELCHVVPEIVDDQKEIAYDDAKG